MNKNKTTYERPTCDLLVIRFEQSLLTISNGVNYANRAGGAGGNDTYGEDDGEAF